MRLMPFASRWTIDLLLVGVYLCGHGKSSSIARQLVCLPDHAC